MRLGFIKPNYPGEKRVALIPEDIVNFENEIVIEEGFGEYLDISDSEYKDKGCEILKRSEVFNTCEAIFSLKLIQESDYQYLKEHQMIIGWSHPYGSGAEFMEKQAIPKKLLIVDLDNIYPRAYYMGKSKDLDWIPKNFIYRNSYMAGVAATMHALMMSGIFPDSNHKVAILSSGNVAQGAFSVCARFGMDTRLFYRKTMGDFYATINEYDIIINGIEVDEQGLHIITKEQLNSVKKGTLIIDAAADAGNAIEGTKYTSIEAPIYKENDLYFYEVNNAPSIYYKTASKFISESFSKYIYKSDVHSFSELFK